MHPSSAATRAAFAAVLHARLETAAMTRRELADRTQIGLRTLHTYLGAQTDVPLSNVVAIAEALGCSLTDLASAIDAALHPAEAAAIGNDHAPQSQLAGSPSGYAEPR